MPNLEALFHYRSIDLSSVKELVRRWRPDLAEHAPQNPVKRHRVASCLNQTLDEARFYRQWLFGPVVGVVVSA